MIAYRFSEERREGKEREERRGEGEEMGQKERRENIREVRREGRHRGEMVERKEEGRGKTQRNSATFPQTHSVQSTVVVSASVWSPRQLSWIQMHASHTTTHIYYK